MSSDYKKLHAAVVIASTEKSWDIAKLEWDFIGAYKDNSERHCVCGHFIVEICQIKNRLNHKILEVGNECVRQFNEDFNEVGKYLIELSQNPNLNTKTKLIEFAFKEGLINSWERKFSLDRVGTRKSSPSQDNTRNAINKKILTQFFGQSCPACGKGKLVDRNGRFGTFTGCNQYPSCEFTQK